MLSIRRGTVAAMLLLLIFCITNLKAETDYHFDMFNVFGISGQNATNRVIKLQSQSPFSGNFFYATSSVAGDFWVSNCISFPTIGNNYVGQILAPPSAISFSFYVPNTNMGSVEAQSFTSIPSNGAQTFPAGSVAPSFQAALNLFELSTNGSSGAITAGTVTNIVKASTNGMTSIVYSNAYSFASTNALFTASNALAAANSLAITNIFATNAAGVSYSGGRGYISTNYDALGAGTTAALAIGLANTNFTILTSNGLQSQIGSAGISAATATNIAAFQAQQVTNGFIAKVDGTNISNFIATNYANTRVTTASNGLAALSLTNAYATNLAGGLVTGQRLYYPTNFDPLGAAASVGSQLTNYTSSATNILLGLINNKANSFQPTLDGATLVNSTYIQGPLTVDTNNAYTNILDGKYVVLGQNVIEANATITGNAIASHAEGDSTSIGNGTANHVEGEGSTITAGLGSHAEGDINTIINGIGAHVEGGNNTINANYAHAEGVNNTATGTASHAAGQSAQATNNNSYVWSDGTTTGSVTNKTFTVNAANGINLRSGVINGNGAGVTNTTSTNLFGAALIQVTNVATSVTVTSAGITNAYGTNFPNGLVTGQRVYFPTNFDAQGGSNFLYQTKLDKTNSTSYGQIATNLTTEGNVAFGLNGASTNIIAATNFIAFNNAGSVQATNGTFVWSASLNLYTNWLNGAVLTNNGSSWLLQTNGVTLYSISGSNPIGTYSAINGAVPAPTSVYTAAINDHMVLTGYFSQTNIVPIFTAITNAIIISSNNAIANLNGLGTNTTLIFTTALWGNSNYLKGGASAKPGEAILSGSSNTINGAYSMIAGGFSNKLDTSGNFDFIGGGYANYLLEGSGAAIVGGEFNTMSSAGFSFIGGGLSNSIAANYSAILGGRNATITNDNTFAWSDGQGLYSRTNNTVLFAATNGLGINTNYPAGYALNVNGAAAITSPGGLYLSGPLWLSAASTNGGVYYLSNTFSLYAVTNSMPNFAHWIGNSNGIMVDIYYSNGVAFMKNNWP